MQHFWKLAQIQGFTGTLVPGDAVDTSLLSGVGLNIGTGPAGMMDVNSDPQASGALGIFTEGQGDDEDDGDDNKNDIMMEVEMIVVLVQEE